MTYTELEKIGWKTMLIDENSFVSKKEYDENKWVEVFYCKEKNYIQYMEAVRGENGEVQRYMKYEGDFTGMELLK